MIDRLEAAFNYVDTLAIKYRAEDYLKNKISLTDNQFHELLNYFIDINDNETSYKLTSRFLELRKLKELRNAKTGFKREKNMV